MLLNRPALTNAGTHCRLKMCSVHTSPKSLGQRRAEIASALAICLAADLYHGFRRADSLRLKSRKDYVLYCFEEIIEAIQDNHYNEMKVS